MQISRSVSVKVAGVVLALASAGAASVAQARSDVYFSVGANVAPGVTLGVSNAPVYYPPRVEPIVACGKLERIAGTGPRARTEGWLHCERC